MTDLNKMWETLAKYQPYADADGHGETWRVMCEERTRDAVWEPRSLAAAAAVAEGAPELLKKEMPLHRHAEKLLAQNGVSKDDPDYHHHLNNTIKHLRQFGNIDLINKSDEQGAAANAAANAEDSEYWAERAIERIKAAIKEREPVLSDMVPVFDDDKQPPKMDAQHSEIEQLKAERDALLADAERYRYLRIHCYRYRWPNNEHDRAMQLSFTVSDIWSNNHDPEVLDGCIDTAREVKP